MYYSEALQREILSMPSGFLPDLGMPHRRAMHDGLFELRLKAADAIMRVFYCTLIGKRIMVLHQFRKKTSRTPRRELEKARGRMKEVKYVDT